MNDLRAAVDRMKNDPALKKELELKLLEKLLADKSLRDLLMNNKGLAKRVEEAVKNSNLTPEQQFKELRPLLESLPAEDRKKLQQLVMDEEKSHHEMLNAFVEANQRRTAPSTTDPASVPAVSVPEPTNSMTTDASPPADNPGANTLLKFADWLQEKYPDDRVLDAGASLLRNLAWQRRSCRSHGAVGHRQSGGVACFTASH